MDRNMKKWHSYKLSDVVRFNPSERLLKGEIAKKVPMDLLQPIHGAFLVLKWLHIPEEVSFAMVIH